MCSEYLLSTIDLELDIFLLNLYDRVFGFGGEGTNHHKVGFLD